MIEKILNLGELKLNNLDFNNEEFKKIVKDLDKIGFFSEEIGKIETYCKKEFSILRKTPNPSDKLNGQDYIREDYFENGRIIKAKIYDFNLNVTSTCS
jgi:hypothetical protein